MARSKISRASERFDTRTEQLTENHASAWFAFLLDRNVLKNSVTYQAILRDGRAEARLEGEIQEARRILLRQGRKRFGQAKAGVKARIEAITDLHQLEQLIGRVLDAKSWDELIGES